MIRGTSCHMIKRTLNNLLMRFLPGKIFLMNKIELHKLPDD